jgi:glutathione S-transferase
MDYLSVAEARQLDGLRLVLTAGVPGPWGESAKAILAHKGIDYVPVLQEAGGENIELLAWTGQNSAPVAILDDEPPACDWLGVLMLAERLAPERPLLPADLEQRALVIGLSHELAGERGFAWDRRLQMLAPMMLSGQATEGVERMAAKYGWSEPELAAAGARLAERLDYLASRLDSQRRLGSDYLVGQSMTALDIYCANFMAMLKPLPHELNPMPAYMRTSYETVDEELASHIQPILFEHRDMMYERHIATPLEF